MKLYKFRDLTNFDRTLDILLNERLYCANFKELNDSFEGIYISISYTPPLGLRRKGVTRKELRDITTLDEFGKVCRVCSLSRTAKDLRLWSHYADGHKGIAIEIDFSGYETDLKPVEYLTELRSYHDVIMDTAFPDKVLSQKTYHWKYEDEVRILQSEPFYLIPHRVSAILLGTRVPETHKSILEKVLAGRIPLIETKINETTLEVEPNNAMHATSA